MDRDPWRLIKSLQRYTCKMALSERRSSQPEPYGVYTPSLSAYRARDQSFHAYVFGKVEG